MGSKDVVRGDVPAKPVLDIYPVQAYGLKAFVPQTASLIVGTRVDGAIIRNGDIESAESMHASARSIPERFEVTVSELSITLSRA